jgi:hypothetical protein
MVGTEKLAGRGLRRAAGGYKTGVVRPLVERIAKARGPKEAIKLLGAGLLKEMDTGELEEALGDVSVQAGMIGRATALPKGSRDRGSKGSR